MKAELVVKTVCKEGICPVCGREIIYGNFELVDGGGVYEWDCPICGAGGKEGYNLVFDGNQYDVVTSGGTPVKIEAPNKEER